LTPISCSLQLNNHSTSLTLLGNAMLYFMKDSAVVTAADLLVNNLAPTE